MDLNSSRIIPDALGRPGDLVSALFPSEQVCSWRSAWITVVSTTFRSHLRDVLEKNSSRRSGCELPLKLGLAWVVEGGSPWGIHDWSTTRWGILLPLALMVRGVFYHTQLLDTCTILIFGPFLVVSHFSLVYSPVLCHKATSESPWFTTTHIVFKSMCLQGKLGMSDLE